MSCRMTEILTLSNWLQMFNDQNVCVFFFSKHNKKKYLTPPESTVNTHPQNLFVVRASVCLCLIVRIDPPQHVKRATAKTVL